MWREKGDEQKLSELVENKVSSIDYGGMNCVVSWEESGGR
jgi:hypothetical protein